MASSPLLPLLLLLPAIATACTSVIVAAPEGSGGGNFILDTNGEYCGKYLAYQQTLSLLSIPMLLRRLPGLRLQSGGGGTEASGRQGSRAVHARRVPARGERPLANLRGGQPGTRAGERLREPREPLELGGVGTGGT